MNKKLMFILVFTLVIPFSFGINYYKFDHRDNLNNLISENIVVNGFLCNDLYCTSQYHSNLWNGQTLDSETDGAIYDITVGIPTKSDTSLPSAIVYSYSFNFLPRTKIIPIYTQISGNNYNTPNSLSAMNFEKIASCSSPSSLSVINNIRENLPVSVTSGASLSSTTKAAFGFEGNVYTGWIRGSEYQKYFEVETTLRLRIYKYNSSTSKNIGSPIHSENVVKRIYYDDTVNVEFTDWMPPEQIDQFSWYNITVVSDVTDPKCSSKVNQRASKLLRVWRDDPRNECYSLIDTDGLVFSPVDFPNRLPEVGQNVTITFRKLSNYANDYEPWDPLFTLTPQDTNINLKLKEENSPDVVITKTLPKNSDDNFKDVSVTWTPQKAGLFTMELYADAATCPVSEDTTSDIYSQSITVFEVPKYDLRFVVKSAGSPVADAKVLIENPLLEKLTSHLGVATINLPRGTYGYRVETSTYTAISPPKGHRDDVADGVFRRLELSSRLIFLYSKQA